MRSCDYIVCGGAPPGFHRKNLPFGRFYGIRRRPTLPDRYQSSTIGTEGLNFCVRYGYRWNPFVIATGNGELFNRLSFRTIGSSLPAIPSPCWERSAPSVLLFFLFRGPQDDSHPDNCTAQDSVITDQVCLFSSIDLSDQPEIKPSTY